MLKPSREIGKFGFTNSQRQRFVAGTLWRDWVKRYPELFDADDVRLAESQAHLGYHFFEWLGAILLYETMGYLSLVEKYEFSGHTRKQAITRRLLSPRLVYLLKNSTGESRAQCPDLLAYTPDMSDWFFCEVKGPGDHISASQADFFEQLGEASGRQVCVMALVKQREGRLGREL